MQSTGRSSFTARGAYTLIELVLVLAVLAIFAAMFTPRYANSMSLYRCQMAAQRIATDIALTQRLAKTSSAGQTITFVLSPSGYTLPGVTGLKGASSSYSVDLTADPYQATLSSVSFNSTTTLSFDRFGQPGSGGSMVVQSGTATHTVTVDPTTGAATIQ